MHIISFSSVAVSRQVCFNHTCRSIMLALLLATSWSRADLRGATPPETLLPAHTVAFVSVKNLKDFDAALGRTQLAGLINDPAMRAFRDAALTRLQQRLLPEGQTLSLSWADILNVPSGEVAIAVLHPSPAVKSAVLLIDVNGRDQQAAELLEDIQQEFTAHQAQMQKATISGVNAVVFTLPEIKDRPKRRFPQALFFIQNGFLVGTESQSAAEEIIQGLKSGQQGNLAGTPSFKYIMQRAAEASGSGAVDVRWYLDPFGFAEAQQVVIGGTLAQQKDVLKILRNQGFSAIRAVGGHVRIADGEHEALHHTVIHAPGFNEGVANFKLAARALQLRNIIQDTPPTWVPRDLAGCTLVNLDVPAGFGHISTLIDEWYRTDENDTQPFFDNLLKDMRDDPNGARVDLKNDVINHLGTKITILGDVTSDIKNITESERTLFAIELKNEAQVLKSISALMVSDTLAEKKQPAGAESISLWEVKPKSANATGRRRTRQPPANRIAPNRQPVPLQTSSGIAVANGYLFIATHFDLLESVLTKKSPPLAESADFQLVNQELAKLGAAKTAVRGFIRRDEANRGNYELLKKGQMPQSKTTLGQVLNVMLAEQHSPGAVREAEIDGSTLPGYDVISRYLGPSGTYLVAEKDGAFITGFVLPK